jgi:hypothetical protein
MRGPFLVILIKKGDTIKANAHTEILFGTKNTLPSRD